MMTIEKRQLRKNKLDLEYHSETQKTNAFLILLTTGMLAFLGTFLWSTKTTMVYYGMTITIVAAVCGAGFYMKSSKRMKEILSEIENI